VREFRRLDRSPSAADRPMFVACALLVLFGIWLRVQDLGFPASFGFDEHHFVPNARNYLNGRSDTNDHPPLGKLIIALAIRLRGDIPVGWRLAPCALGIGTILFAAALAQWAFRDRRAGWIAAALIAIDGFFVSYSRMALLDGMLTSLCLAAFVVLLRGRSYIAYLLGPFLLGSACAVKFTPVVFLPALAIIVALRCGKAKAALAVTFVVATYAAWFSVGLRLAKQPADVHAVAKETARLFLHHARLTDWKNPLCSHWYEWFAPRRPIVLQMHEIPDGRVRVSSSLGNLALWWAVDCAIFVTAVEALVRAIPRIRELPKLRVGTLLDSAFGRRLALGVLWSAPIAPWMFAKRDSYMYHYLPAYGFGVVLVAGLLATTYARRRTVGLIALLIISEVSFYYAPVWDELPISRQGFQRRLFAATWK
jgi:dolichyl-phosphate-mannose--protein O-mannosyl transferase